MSDGFFARRLAEAHARSVGIRRLLEQAGVAVEEVCTPSDLARLPVTPKEHLSAMQREDPPFGGFLAAPLHQVKRVFMSPGPIYDVEGAEAGFWHSREALVAAGFGPGDVVINTFSYHLSPASFLVEAGLHELGATVIPAGVGSKEQQVQVMREAGATGYTGVPSYLLALLEEAERQVGQGRAAAPPGSDPRTGLRLRKAWFTAEKLDESLRQRLQDVYGIDAYQGYGTAELGMLAYECVERRGMHLVDAVVVELLDPATREPVPDGTPGEVVVTSLGETYPLVRLGTGDLSSVLPGDCACGRPSPRLSGILGRVGEAVKVRGMFLYPHHLRELLSRFPELTAVHGRVDREEHRDVLHLAFAADPLPDPDRAQDLRERIVAQAREVTRVRPDRIDFLPPDALPQGRLLEDARAWEAR
ncbi:putative phenylacetate-coenzyme A ligase [Limnochorda pilosa]|uniref:Putative phenylacetate-coenzyme A ligase n=2 Tax=Limnochorda pilosa TaxID=1555112 RepID=A0A0K2SGA2_LIMPI|nr:putative phenylacetate-coenzyme A ligase [Limnochorda pilosa]